MLQSSQSQRVPLLEQDIEQYGCFQEHTTLTPEGLSELIRTKQRSEFEKLGGLNSLLMKLNSDALLGLHKDFPYEERRKEFGANYIPPPPEPSYFQLIFEGLHDTTLLMLITSAIVSLVLGLGLEQDFKRGWIEGVSILVSVSVVLNVQAATDYSKAWEFRRQQLELENQQQVEVIRNGDSLRISPKKLVVGDIIRFGVGDILPADGILLEGSDVKIDESSLTGETELVSKSTEDDCFLLSGTNVMNGSGKLLILAVGDHSVQGSILLTVGSSKEEINIEGAGTLVEKLDAFSIMIGKFGSIIALLAALILIVRWSSNEFLLNKSCKDLSKETCDSLLKWSCSFLGDSCIRVWVTTNDLASLLNFFVTGITVLVVAVPEGLPLAVTLSLAVSIRRMMKDNNQVKHLDSCETMGSATTICSDKTGTLTLNKMSVVRCFIGDQSFDKVPTEMTSLGEKIKKYSDQSKGLSKSFLHRLAESIILNSSSTSNVLTNPDGSLRYTGNATECALIKLTHEYGYCATKMRENQLYKSEGSNLDWGVFVFPFSSERKRMTTVVSATSEHSKIPGRFLVYSKGAPHHILDVSTSYLAGHDLEIVPMNDEKRNFFDEKIDEYQRNGLRTIAIAYRELDQEPSNGWNTVNGSLNDTTDPGPKDLEQNLTLIGIFGIEDPLRPEVVDAIQKCNHAGVDVRMCTGDALTTAICIARQAGILRASHMNGDTPKPNFAMTGPEFRARIDKLDTTKRKRLRKVYDCATEKVQDKLEYPVLRDEDGEIVLDQEAFDEIWPKLRVLARCQPEDKLALVNGIKKSLVFADSTYCEELLRSHGINIFPDYQVVAVTGDGTNDAPALKRADVGFAMGIVGTATAKQACDILLMDDNFASIVQAIKWGRNVYDSISKFIQFQLTVNLVAIVIALLGALVFSESPLSAVQMLWINLIMDSLASLALATEPPTEKLLDRMPYGKRRPILSRIMCYNILGQACFQLIVLLVMLFYPSIIPGNVLSNESSDTTTYGSTHWTVLFNAFVQLQIFNEFNSRKLQTVKHLKQEWNEWNVFNGITQNKLFILIVGSSFILQIFIVQFGGAAFRLCEDGLNLEQWLYCVGIGALSLIWQQMLNIVILLFEKEDETLSPPKILPHGYAKKRWLKIRRNIQYGNAYARLFHTHLKEGLIISRLTLARRRKARKKYRYPYSKQDSLETEKIIRRLAQRTFKKSPLERGN